MSKKAIVLLSGGLDSLTTLAIAQNEGYECFALHVIYGQRHSSETMAARNIAKNYNLTEFREINVDMSWLKSSALTNHDISIPEQRSEGIPVTYVPARNTIMMSFAAAWAESLEASHLFLGVNAVDYSGYPDCRPEFIEAFKKMVNLGTKAAIEGVPFDIHTPLIGLTKEEIISKGIDLGVDYSLSISCYQADQNGYACGKCDSCYLRSQGFEKAGIQDPTPYAR
ncbi:MAG: 7-cyano-7-deazaguanine synthase QueC [Betaproteobacteria bacterium]|nr:7-cyano-7-deazaguanine synthase QueC [Nitrosomonadales bacterium]NCV53422.1 7-cyano-7-deazaguanine synthase QueC [Betaproteobacteria bacterium]NCW63695.1 7-cyano-7-deazaguanine synthase QueC [Betaproteobacteria bacterium]NCX68491.1 7-cyano-7-deazaguanine synthase QueC [Betaproteobacteria bacterium]